MNALTFFKIFDFAINAVVMIFMIRILLQLARASIFNPVALFVHKFTNPIVTPMRKIAPDMGRFSLASLVIIIVLIVAKFFAFQQFLLPDVPTKLLVLGVLFGLPLKIITIHGFIMIAANLLLMLFFGLMIASFITQGRPHPVANFLFEVTRPILRPIQRIIPPLGGTLDLSPMVVLLGLYFLQSAIYRYIVPYFFNS